MQPKDILDPAFVRCYRLSHVEPNHPEPTLRDVMQCLVVAHEERRWIMVSISGVMWHLGIDHPPFPKVGPSFQPPTQA